MLAPEGHASRAILFSQVWIGGLLWSYRATINGVQDKPNAGIFGVGTGDDCHHSTRASSPREQQTAGTLATFANNHFDIGVFDRSIATSWPIEPTRERAKLIGHRDTEDIERPISVLCRVQAKGQGYVGISYAIVVKVRFFVQRNFHSVVIFRC